MDFRISVIIKKMVEDSLSDDEVKQIFEAVSPDMNNYFKKSSDEVCFTAYVSDQADLKAIDGLITPPLGGIAGFRTTADNAARLLKERIIHSPQVSRPGGSFHN